MRLQNPNYVSKSIILKPINLLAIIIFHTIKSHTNWLQYLYSEYDYSFFI